MLGRPMHRMTMINPMITKYFEPTPSIFRQSGFTLVEMMAVVAIIAILSSLALPAYRDNVMRGKIPEATAHLSLKRVQMEQFFQDNRTYVGAPACNADAATSQYFNFSCPVQTATTFTLQAVGKGDMAGFTYTIDQSGAKATTAVPAGWGAPAATCWIAKKGGSC
jgi:type IV pilus assembly protein PilE